MSPTSFDTSQKVRPEHLDRAAHVYVRQSSYYQVEHNLESQRRQYDLRLRAVDLGWPAERVVVIDEDQGKSSRDPGTRDGFTRLATAVGRGEVGIVLSLEASRLARNNPEWYQLIYLCRWTSTLLGDELGLYDPADANDRLLLGIRGQMSELALETDIRRMVEARWSKARRGEFLIYPPAGYEVDELDQLVLTSDLAVREAIRTVFTKFDELGTARQVFVWWQGNQLQFPVRRSQLRGHPVVWVPPRYRGILEVLHNPIYAGAYVPSRPQATSRSQAPSPGKPSTRLRQRPRRPPDASTHVRRRPRCAVRSSIQPHGNGSHPPSRPQRASCPPAPHHRYLSRSQKVSMVLFTHGHRPLQDGGHPQAGPMAQRRRRGVRNLGMGGLV